MSILIKGMDMPSRCENCCMLAMVMGGTAYTGYWCKATYKKREDDCGTRPSWCPLIELPPHGRLIDADTLKIKSLRMIVQNALEYDRKALWQMIDDAPTIIKSEGEDG